MMLKIISKKLKRKFFKMLLRFWLKFCKISKITYFKSLKTSFCLTATRRNQREIGLKLLKRKLLNCGSPV